MLLSSKSMKKSKLIIYSFSNRNCLAKCIISVLKTMISIEIHNKKDNNSYLDCYQT